MSKLKERAKKAPQPIRSGYTWKLLNPVMTFASAEEAHGDMKKYVPKAQRPKYGVIYFAEIKVRKRKVSE